MFRLIKLQPPHGWIAVWWELAIVTTGVLIALFAEQFVGMLKSRNDAAEFRAATKDEIATNLHAYQFRFRQGACVARRIAELEQWRDDAVSKGRARPLSGQISRPSILTTRTAAWDSRGDVTAQMPLEERLDYAEIYAIIATNHQQMLDEREAWTNLSAFNGATRIDPVSVMRLNELLFRVASTNSIIQRNWPQAVDFGKRLGVRPDPGRRRAYIRVVNPRFCESLLS